MAGVIYLDIDDEITSAAARIRSAEGSRVAVVLPYGSRVATSRINFRLLARDALTNGKRLSIVAGDGATRALAASAGLPIFATVGEYESSLEEDRSGTEAEAWPWPQRPLPGSRPVVPGPMPPLLSATRTKPREPWSARPSRRRRRRGPRRARMGQKPPRARTGPLRAPLQPPGRWRRPPPPPVGRPPERPPRVRQRPAPRPPVPGWRRPPSMREPPRRPAEDRGRPRRPGEKRSGPVGRPR